MKLSDALKAYLIKTFGLPEDASDELLKKTIGEKMASGELTAQQILDVEKAASNGAAAKVGAIVDEKIAPVLKSVEMLTSAMAKFVEVQSATKPGEAKPEGEKAGEKGTDAEGTKGQGKPFELDEEEFTKRVEAAVAKVTSPSDSTAKALRIYGVGNPTVKNAVERYSDTKTALIAPERTKGGRGSRHYSAGSQVSYMGRPLNQPTPRDGAIALAFWKAAAARSCREKGLPIFPAFRMSEEDNQILAYAIHELEWDGDLGPGQAVRSRKLNSLEKAALIDDSPTNTIGGQLNPVLFDELLVMVPLLNGEFFPDVELVPVDRGSHVQGASITPPTMSWGQAEGSSISLFDPSGNALVGAINTTIYPVMGAMEVGKDLAEDSPANIIASIQMAYGERHLTELDKVIATGSGTGQPLGLVNTTGAIAALSANGVAGPITLGDTELLEFNVAKQYKKDKGGRMAFFGNTATYRRLRGMPRGPVDAQRLLGTANEEYKILQTPYKTSDDIAAGVLGYANLGYYRLYRRRGVEIVVETAGETLRTRNAILVVCRARYGGQMTLGNAVSVMTNLSIA